MRTESHSKVDLIHSHLEKRILAGDWKLGDQIPTEGELAAEFNCSRGTVCKAIERLVHDGLVQRRTRAGTRVIKTVATEKRSLIGLDACAFIYPNEQHEGIRRIVHGFQDAARDRKRRIVTLTTGADFRKEAEIIGRLGEFDVKGAVVYPVLPEAEDRIFFEQMLLTCRFPVVLTDITLPGLGCPAVVVDGFHAGYTMTRRLTEQGLRRIGFLTDYAWVPYMRDRYQGYRRALEEAGIEERPEWVLLERSMRPDFTHPIAACTVLARKYLQGASTLEGVVCGHDFVALGCLAAAQEANVRAPAQLKVVGIDDFALAAQSQPALTTYRIPYEELGRQAFQVLEGLLRGETPLKAEMQVRGSLVVRKSG